MNKTLYFTSIADKKKTFINGKETIYSVNKILAVK